MDIRRLCKERDAYRETLEFIVAGPRFKRERLTVTDWAEAYEEASDAARDALDNFSKEKK
jgi:hypothetical protein